MLDTIFEVFRTFLKGAKTYLTAIAGIVAALLGFSEGVIDVSEMVAAITAALGLASLRAGIKTEVKKVLGE